MSYTCKKESVDSIEGGRGVGRLLAGAMVWFVAAISGTVCGGDVLCVNAAAIGGNDGTNWIDAFTDLQDALTAAKPGDEIWVATGTYVPSARTDPDDPRSATFRLVDGVRFYGGFAGSETLLAHRNLEVSETILSGDLAGDDGPDFANNDENAYHVVTGESVGDGTIVDGFTITAGNANGTHAHGRGGGMTVSDAWLTIINCRFIANAADPYRNSVAGGQQVALHPGPGGAGLYVGDFAAPNAACRISACTFERNVTTGSGGGLYIEGLTEIRDCLFIENSASSPS